MLYFFLFFIWIWLLISVFADIFRSPELSGWGKALWSIFVIVMPFLGVFVYLIARGSRMHEHAAREAQAQDEAMRAYIRETVATPTSDGGPAEQVAHLVDLRNHGVIDEGEFERLKAKIAG
jgi:hypothetical protein